MTVLAVLAVSAIGWFLAAALVFACVKWAASPPRTERPDQ